MLKTIKKLALVAIKKIIYFRIASANNINELKLEYFCNPTPILYNFPSNKTIIS